MLCDFYGDVLVPPAKVDHSKLGFDLATLRPRLAGRFWDRLLGYREALARSLSLATTAMNSFRAAARPATVLEPDERT